MYLINSGFGEDAARAQPLIATGPKKCALTGKQKSSKQLILGWRIKVPPRMDNMTMQLEWLFTEE
jgi:hypothetical protein